MSGAPIQRAQRAPSVSVVVPAFNAERTLAATLESVLAQTFRDFEVIVIDDGSTDRTPAIAGSFAERDPRVWVVSQRNGGVADARNAGIRQARAALVSPIDSDDVWHETFLEKLHAALTAAGEDTLFAFANFRNIDMEGRVLGSAPHHPVSGRVFHRFMLKNFVGNGSGMMFRREAALAVGGYERRLQHEFGAQGCEDWLLQMRLAGRGGAVGVSEYLVGYREVPGAMSSDQVRMWRSRIHAFEILFEELGCEETTAARWGLGRARAHCMAREVLAGEVAAGFRSLRIALTHDPVGTFDLLLEAVTRGARRGARLLQRSRWRGAGAFADLDPLEQRRPLTRGLLARRIEHMTLADLESSPVRPARRGRVESGAPAATGRALAPENRPNVRSARRSGRSDATPVETSAR